MTKSFWKNRTTGSRVAGSMTPRSTSSALRLRSLTLGIAVIATLVVAPSSAHTGPLDCTVGGLIDPCKEEEWSRAYDEPSARGGSEGHTGRNDATNVLFSPSGDRVFLVGEVRTGSNQNMTRVWAVDPATGDELWVSRYGGPGGNNFKTHDAVLSIDGSRLFVTGSSRADLTSSDSDATTAAFDTATGERLWVTSFDGPGEPPAVDLDWGKSVRPSPDDEHVYVAISSHGGPNGNDIQTVAYRADTGEVEWSVRYEAPDLQQPSALAVTPDGNRVVVVGYGEGDGKTDGQTDRWDWDWVVVAYETGEADGTTGGEEAWRAPFDAPQHGYSYDAAVEVVMDPDGERVFVIGQSGDTGTTADFTTLALDVESGTVQWEARFRPDGAAGLGYTSWAQAVTDPEGRRLFITGRGQRQTNGYNWDMVTAAFDTETGRLLWSDSYDQSALAGVVDSRMLEAGRDISVAPDGDDVFVSGWYETFITVAYDTATGLRRWTAGFNSAPENRDWVSANAISPDGSQLFVAGEFSYTEAASSQEEPANNSDAGLVVYDLTDRSQASPTSTPTQTKSASSSPSESASSTPSPSESPEPDLADVSFTDNAAGSGQHSDETLLEARLSDSDGGSLEGRELSFELRGSESTRSFTAITNEEGVATVTPELEENPGPHWVTVRFAGDDEYAADADTASFIVEKEDSALELSVHGEDDDTSLATRLSDLDTSSQGIAERTIDFYSNGELIGSAVTNADGAASFALPPRHRGKNLTYEAVFEGDNIYLESSDERPGKGKDGNGGDGGSGSRDVSTGAGAKVFLM